MEGESETGNTREEGRMCEHAPQPPVMHFNKQLPVPVPMFIWTLLVTNCTY